MPPPASPTRQATRLRTPERSAKTQDAVVLSSDSGVESSRLPGSADTELPSAAGEEEAPKSPGRRSSRRSKTSSVTRQESSSAPQEEAEAEAAKSPSRRSTRHALPGPEETAVPEPPTRRSTRHSRTGDTPATQEPASPSRRSGPRSKTPERSAGSPLRQKSGAEKSDAGKPSLIENEDPNPHVSTTSPSRRARSGERTVVDAAAASASPGRRSTRSGRTLSEESTESVPASPGRRSAARSDSTGPGEPVESVAASPSRQASPGGSVDRSASGEPVESAASASRRLSRGRSASLERSPAGTSSHRPRSTGSRGEDESSPEVKDIAAVTEEVRSSRRQQKEAELSPRAGAAVSRVAEETGTSSFWSLERMRLTQ